MSYTTHIVRPQFGKMAHIGFVTPTGNGREYRAILCGVNVTYRPGWGSEITMVEAATLTTCPQCTARAALAATRQSS